MSPRLLLLAGVLLAGAGCVKSATPAAPADRNPPFAFPHQTHADADLACTTCHASISSARSLQGAQVHVALPTGEAAQSCSSCHETAPQVPVARTAADQTVRFSHADHLPRVNGDCRRCHTQLTEPAMDKAPVPAMAACTSCHEHAEDYAQARCTPCHVDLKRVPLKPVSDYRHAADFLRTHGEQAKANAATCAACHDQTSCAECHAAATRPVKPDVQWPEKVGASFIHRGDYVSRHAIDAAADPASCRRCHGSAYCGSCHAEQGISPGVTAGPRTDPHPAGWNAGAVHGPAARRDILSCASCHDQGASATCVACHRNVNPHPVGYGSRHNKTSDVANNSMCRTCHSS